jgi:hypothetical protein
MPPGIIDATYGQSSVFVVEHDWARAFASAPDVFNGPVTLPDTSCVFEFCISGHLVIALMGQVDDNPTLLPYLQTKEGWVTFGSFLSRHGVIGSIRPTDDNQPKIVLHDAGDHFMGTFKEMPEGNDLWPLLTLIDRQVRAVGVALDAQVAVKTAVRMPYKSNQPPKGRGQAEAVLLLPHGVARAARGAARSPRG